MSVPAMLARRVAIVPRAVVAAHGGAPLATRSFSATHNSQKTATDSVKDGVKKVDRAVSDTIVEGLDAATAAKDKVKGQAEKVTGQAGGKAEELKGQAKGAAAEAQGKGKGAAAEAAGKAKETASEVQNAAQTAANKAKEKL